MTALTLVALTSVITAALMTAANAGARTTGWGFVLFTLGSLAWAADAWRESQTNFLISNGFLTCVNAFGVWRWLGKRSRYQDGAGAAAIKSARAHLTPLISVSSLLNRDIVARNGKVLGKVIDLMLECDTQRSNYFVVEPSSTQALKPLVGVHPEHLSISIERIEYLREERSLAECPALDADDWPSTLPRS